MGQTTTCLTPTHTKPDQAAPNLYSRSSSLPHHNQPQAVYSTGLTTIMIYYAYFGLWPVFCPVAVELTCILYLTALKIYLENIAQPITVAEEILGGSTSPGYNSIGQPDLELQK